MRAAVYEKYGPPEVVHVAEVPTPTPKDDEVLIRIRATTVTSGDWRIRSLSLPGGFSFMGRLVFGISKPRQPILGSEIAGEIAAVGKAVTRFKAGDRVIAFTGAKGGTHAEYRTFPEAGVITPMPANLNFEQAASLPFGGTTALIFLRRGLLKAGEAVLVNGASGAVGVAAVQIAKAMGATVTAVTSGGNADLLRSLGADRVIDYARTDFAKEGKTYDVILTTAGAVTFARVKGSLKPKGRLLLVLGGLGDAVMAPFAGFSGKKVVAGPISVKPDDLRAVADLAATGKLKPVIDSVFPLDEIVAAHARVDTGRKRGSVVVRMA